LLSDKSKISSEINLENELLLDALMTDNVDVHPPTVGTLHTLTAVDVHSLITDDDVAVCSHSIYQDTRPHLTDSLGPSTPACLCVLLLLLLLQLSLDINHC